MRIEIVVNERIVRSGYQREDLQIQIQKENTGKENRMLNWVRAGYGWFVSILTLVFDRFYHLFRSK
jgi:hypothetical protein